MIFKPEYADAILNERKTVTRRPANGPCKHRVGSNQSVQPGQAKFEVARILITGITLEPLEPFKYLTKEARAEGFRSWPHFAAAWKEIYGSYDPGQMVYRIEFEVTNGIA